MHYTLKQVENILDSGDINESQERDYHGGDYAYFDFYKSRFDYLYGIYRKYYKPGAKLLDIGSLFGYGCLGAKFIGYKVSGLDLEKYVTAFGPRFERFEINNVVCDLAREAMPFADEEFDVLVASEVLGHFKFHPSRFFKEALRVLRPGGLIIITSPNLLRLNNIAKMFFGYKSGSDIKDEQQYTGEYREFTAAEIIYLVQKSGLVVEKIEFKNFNYPNLSWPVKILNRFGGLIFPHRQGNIIIIARKKLRYLS